MGQVLDDYNLRAYRVLRERRLNGSKNLIYSGFLLIVVGLCMSVIYARPDFIELLALPVVLGVLMIWRWYVWVSV